MHLHFFVFFFQWALAVEPRRRNTSDRNPRPTRHLKYHLAAKGFRSSKCCGSELDLIYTTPPSDNVFHKISTSTIKPHPGRFIYSAQHY